MKWLMQTNNNFIFANQLYYVRIPNKTYHCGMFKHKTQVMYIQYGLNNKVSEGAKIRNRYNQVPHLTQDTNGKVITSQLDTTKESQEVSPFQAGDHKAQINRLAQRHNNHKTEA